MNLSNLVPFMSKFFNRETWMDRYAEPTQKFVNKVFQSGGVVGQKIANLLNGTWLGHPLHPVLTDIPVGAWVAAIALDSIEASTGRRGIGRAADTAIAIGVAGAAGSAVTGIADWQHTVGESRRVGFVHGLLNTVSLGLFIASLAARGDGKRGLGRMLALTGFGVVSASAYLGGDLVYRLRMGVDHSPESTDIKTQDYVPVMTADQLPQNRLAHAMLRDTPLVLLRRGDRVYALAASCAHLGGPLPDGQLEMAPDGSPIVVCPWHGSRFDMQTGAVLDGPSAYPQPCFDARIRDGRVEVRHLLT